MRHPWVVIVMALMFVARFAPTARAESEYHPELVGCALIGAWALCKSRRHRIV
jgi:hypothetical protein